jgi:hypothetical protein
MEVHINNVFEFPEWFDCKVFDIASYGYAQFIAGPQPVIV